jgi:hypothetical protein
MIGCPVTPAPSMIKDLKDEIVIEEDSSFFVKNEATGIIDFITNDTKYSGQFGYTLWTQEDEVYNPFSILNVTLNKSSGNDAAGYGVVFGNHDDTMLVVLINTMKEFIIGELTANLFTELQPWNNAVSLKSGYNQFNNIDITYNSISGNFTLSFNGGETITFRDDEEPFHTYGKSGYIVVISPMDNFPAIPVSITFKKN